VKKAHIIAEIRRTAAANGGTPLGYVRFEAETGIKYTDWSGVHWARWSDAVREASFEPNQLQSAYDKNYLLARFAQLALELGRIPAQSDLRLKRRKDRGFPGVDSFGRFGAKAHLVRQLAQFCRSREGLAQVVGWCDQYLESVEDNSKEKAATDESDFSCVYLLKSGRSYKVGKSNSVGRREYELRLQLRQPVRMVHAIRTDDPSGIEEYWHKRFATKHLNGEWFALQPADIRAFKRRKFM
jgi:Meiotically up-regulated gene 113